MALVVATGLLFIPFKDLILSKIRHQRNCRYFVFGLLYLALAMYLYKINKISLQSVAFLATIDVFYLIYCFFTIDHCSPIATYYLQKYEKLLEKGLTTESIGYFEKKHWYISEVTDKIAYARLKARYYADLGQINIAYKAVDEIRIETLYPSEVQNFETFKAMFLWQMGDFSTATKLLENERHESNPIKYLLAAFIFEYSGNLDDAYKQMKEAMALCSNTRVSPEYHMQILENYGKIHRLRGNLTEAVCYLQQANKMLEQMDNPRADIQKNIKEDLISIEVLVRGADPFVQELLDKYKKQIPANSIKNLISFNNCCIEVYCQIGDKKKVYDLIKSGYYEIIDKLDETERSHYQASIFCMLMNGEYVHDWLDIEIDKSYKNYSNLPVMERIVLYREFAKIFQQQKFSCIRNKKPYRELWDQIKMYYRNAAIDDIDNQIASLSSYEIFKKGKLLQDKLAILKYLQRDKHIEKSKQIYVDLYNMYNDVGLQIEAVNILMILINECGSPYNVMIRPNRFSAWTLYQDWIDSLPDEPDPQLLSGEYQLKYYQSQPEVDSFYPLAVEVMEECLNKIIPTVKRWHDHPAKYIISLQIAINLMRLGRKDDAKLFYDIFCENKLSIDHYDSGVKEDYYALTKEFAPHKLQKEPNSNSI